MPTVTWLVTTHSGDNVIRYDADGTFVDEFVPARSGRLREARDFTYGPDGHLHVVHAHESRSGVLPLHGRTGAFIDHFVRPGSGGLKKPSQFAWGPDGNLYVGSEDTNQVLRYDGTTGAFIDVFVDGNRPDGGGLKKPSGLAWGPLDGHL